MDTYKIRRSGKADTLARGRLQHRLKPVRGDGIDELLKARLAKAARDGVIDQVNAHQRAIDARNCNFAKAL